MTAEIQSGVLLLGSGLYCERKKKKERKKHFIGIKMEVKISRGNST